MFWLSPECRLLGLLDCRRGWLLTAPLASQSCTYEKVFLRGITWPIGDTFILTVLCTHAGIPRCERLLLHSSA